MRLPIYRSVRIVDVRPDVAVTAMDETARQYPCPECSTMVPQERLAIVEYHALVDSSYADQSGYLAHVKEHSAHHITSQLLKDGFIRFERGPDDDREMRFATRATVGVVAPKHVATIEERAARHQKTLAREAAAEAVRLIMLWGSHYTGGEGHIPKAQAVDEVNRAVKTALAKRSAMKPMR